MLVNQELRLLQINLHKHKERTHAILNDPAVKDYTILLLQGQYWSQFIISSPIHHSWTLYEPTLKRHDIQPRAVIYTNNAQLRQAQITQLDLSFTDAAAISINYDHNSEKESILIINIYNPCGENIIKKVYNALTKYLNQIKHDIILMAGDFNCYHLL